MLRFDFMHLTQVDLNLLVVLDALLDTQSIKDAADRLSLSPSATSHALGRLRAQFDDELLTRAGRRMVLTARALRLQQELREVLDGVEALYRPPGVRDIGALDRTFVLGANDFFEIVLLPRLFVDVRRQAPRVDLHVRPLTDSGILGLRNGAFDVTFGVYGDHGLPDDVRLHPVMDSRFVCLLRRDHPALERRWTIRRYAQLDHILVSPRGQPWGIVDDRLGEVGLRRRIALTVSNFSSAPALVASSDCVLTISEHIAEAFAERYALVRRPPPIEVPTFTVSAMWHARQANDPELKWLIDLCSSTVAPSGPS